jgi:hypothetical protein
VPSAGGLAAEPAADHNLWGWTTVRQTSLGIYTPAPRDRGNSAGLKNTVKQASVGSYTLTFKGIGDDGGVPHVTVLGSAQRICLINHWWRGSNPDDEEVGVGCFRLNGIRASTAFTVTYRSTTIDSGPMAYLWTAGAASETANSQYSYNSTSQTNEISHTGTGRYSVTLHGLGEVPGHVQLSGYDSTATSAGTSPAGTNPATCAVVSWGTSGANQIINIKCRESHGLAANSGFLLTFLDHEGLKGHSVTSAAYFLANQKSKASYRPPVAFRWQKPAGTPRVTRQGAGRYTAKLPGMPNGGGVLVTVYGSVARTCQVGSIRASTTPQQVTVRCFTFSGTPSDATFLFAYLR